MNTEPIIPVAPRSDDSQARLRTEESKQRDEATEAQQRKFDAPEPATQERAIRAETERAQVEPADRERADRERATDGRGDSAETSFLADQDLGPTHERWQQIQAVFVDDPRKSVSEAHELVGEITQRIVDAFARERDALEKQWSAGADVSTEDLRVCLQRYRAFFSRLLPSANKFES